VTIFIFVRLRARYRWPGAQEYQRRLHLRRRLIVPRYPVLYRPPTNNGITRPGTITRVTFEHFSEERMLLLTHYRPLPLVSLEFHRGT